MDYTKVEDLTKLAEASDDLESTLILPLYDADRIYTIITQILGMYSFDPDTNTIEDAISIIRGCNVAKDADLINSFSCQSLGDSNRWGFLAEYAEAMGKEAIRNSINTHEDFLKQQYIEEIKKNPHMYVNEG
jgi:hypothetical protein